MFNNSLKVGSYTNSGSSFHEWSNLQISPNSNGCRGKAHSGTTHSPLLATINSSSSLGNQEVLVLFFHFVH